MLEKFTFKEMIFGTPFAYILLFITRIELAKGEVVQAIRVIFFCLQLSRFNLPWRTFQQKYYLC